MHVGTKLIAFTDTRKEEEAREAAAIDDEARSNSFQPEKEN